MFNNALISLFDSHWCTYQHSHTLTHIERESRYWRRRFDYCNCWFLIDFFLGFVCLNRCRNQISLHENVHVMPQSLSVFSLQPYICFVHCACCYLFHVFCSLNWLLTLILLVFSISIIIRLFLIHFDSGVVVESLNIVLVVT